MNKKFYSPSITAAVEVLNQEIVSQKRRGRSYTFVLIPCDPKEPIFISVDGREDYEEGEPPMPITRVRDAIRKRSGN